MPTTPESFLTDKLPEYLDLLYQMVSINSFTENAAGVNRLGRLIAEHFERNGFKAEFVSSAYSHFGNHLFLRRPAQNSQAPLVALVSHLDTVFPPEEEIAHDFHWRQQDGRIFGPGVVDIKGGTVMILMVLEALQKFQPDLFEAVDWLICLDASEEQLSDDFSFQCRQRIPAAGNQRTACLVFEGGTPEPDAFSIVTARKGRVGFKISTAGRSAHAGNYHWQGANAIVQLATVIPQVAAFTDYQKHLTYNIGVIRGGTVVNRVPHAAECHGEMRAFDPEIFDQGIQQLQTLDGLSTLSSVDGFPCRVTVEISGRSAPWPTNPDTMTLFELWQEAGRALNMKVIQEQRGGLSDGNLLWQHVPVLDGLGPVGGNAHCSEHAPDGTKEQEFVEIASFVPKAILNLQAISRWIRL